MAQITNYVFVLKLSEDAQLLADSKYSFLKTYKSFITYVFLCLFFRAEVHERDLLYRHQLPSVLLEPKYYASDGPLPYSLSQRVAEMHELRYLP